MNKDALFCCHLFDVLNTAASTVPDCSRGLAEECRRRMKVYYLPLAFAMLDSVPSYDDRSPLPVAAGDSWTDTARSPNVLMFPSAMKFACSSGRKRCTTRDSYQSGHFSTRGVKYRCLPPPTRPSRRSSLEILGEYRGKYIPKITSPFLE